MEGGKVDLQAVDNSAQPRTMQKIFFWITCRWGFKKKQVPRKVHVNTTVASIEEKEVRFQKKTTGILMGTRYQKKGFTLVSLDESFFLLFIDAPVRRVYG